MIDWITLLLGFLGITVVSITLTGLITIAAIKLGIIRVEK
jgi:hypothetical protein